MKNYLNAITPQARTQRERLDPNQQKNHAGGFVYAVSDEMRLTRFLVLGTDGGTFYASERDHTVKATDFLRTFAQLDGARMVQVILDVVRAGRAPKMDPALLALALVAKTGSLEARKAAWDALPEVARTGTMLLHFLAFAQGLGGWGRLTRRGVARVYEDAPIEKLALWAVKYKARDGWSQADALRLAHPKTTDAVRNAVFRFMVDGVLADATDPALRVIEGHVKALAVSADADAAALMHEYGLPIEAIPTPARGPRVYRAAMRTNGLTWLMRNLGNLSRVGVLTPNDTATLQEVVARLTDPAALRKGRIHPIDALKARLVYASGRGVRGKGEWLTVPRVVDALETAFYTSFGHVQRADKRFLLGIDVSGSMTWGTVAGVPGLSPNVAASAMSMVTARTEPFTLTMGFTDGFRNLGITPADTLDAAMRKTQAASFGATDCAQPMLWARQHKIEVDTFVVYTDNETWAGAVHPKVALDQYRQATGIPARLVVVGMTATQFTIADPNDAGMLDVVGFDSAAPGIMSAFARGEL
ncbi:RNA-binding protein Rsr [Deinococcus maricopensis]|uniref:TROVE domain-containing protein n=1 Tax=Deinococcus maricopensis (strain DSM 21211 / LMG 22137 / NRRL B-23946 / LB-34) TaxID=709986 RepID=E8U8B6_DEIML|nr:RNA-binding protein Rsr [Deinococcus maricopensis]ADV67305.1 TROVE domain-containing protein [Deinococcus maricopensis DSM 21211]